MDSLSEMLSLLKLQSYMAGGFDHGGDWSVQFPAYSGIKCHALLAGECWLAVEGIADALLLEAGDCTLLPRGLPFRLCSDLRLPPVDAHSLDMPPPNGRIRVLNGGGGCTMIAGYFGFQGSQASMLLDELPPIVHPRAEHDKAELRWCLDRMQHELREQRAGSSLIAQHLAMSLLIQAMRLHIEDGLEVKAGWLAAMADPQLKVAVTSIHDKPGHRWTLQELAQASGMSRSSFASRFKMRVGTSPMEYVTRWRMMLASHWLTTSSESVSNISASLGYDSETAFRAAFRKIMACSPLQYRRGDR